MSKERNANFKTALMAGARCKKWGYDFSLFQGNIILPYREDIPESVLQMAEIYGYKIITNRMWCSANDLDCAIYRDAVCAEIENAKAYMVTWRQAGRDGWEITEAVIYESNLEGYREPFRRTGAISGIFCRTKEKAVEVAQKFTNNIVFKKLN